MSISQDMQAVDRDGKKLDVVLEEKSHHLLKAPCMTTGHHSRSKGHINSGSKLITQILVHLTHATLDLVLLTHHPQPL